MNMLYSSHPLSFNSIGIPRLLQPHRSRKYLAIKILTYWAPLESLYKAVFSLCACNPYGLLFHLQQSSNLTVLFSKLDFPLVLKRLIFLKSSLKEFHIARRYSRVEKVNPSLYISASE